MTLSFTSSLSKWEIGIKEKIPTLISDSLTAADVQKSAFALWIDVASPSEAAYRTLLHLRSQLNHPLGKSPQKGYALLLNMESVPNVDVTLT